MDTFAYLTAGLVMWVILLVLTWVEEVWRGRAVKIMHGVTVVGSAVWCCAAAVFLTQYFYDYHTLAGLVGTVVMGAVCLASLAYLVYSVRQLNRPAKSRDDVRRLHT